MMTRSLLDHAVGGILKRPGKIRPGEQSGEIEDGVRDAAGRDLGQTAEEKCENQHGHQRLEDGPSGPDRGLLVAKLDVAPDEEIGQFAELPQLAKIQLQPTFRRGDVSYRDIRQRDWHLQGAHG